MNFDVWLAQYRAAFPQLTTSNCRHTSPEDPTYNCIAWAAEDTSRWWWPDALGQQYWPAELGRGETLDAFRKAYGLLGYDRESDSHLEPGIAKVAIFTDLHDVPTHAARQLPDGWWASKLGPNIDIEHVLEALEGPAYGRVRAILQRRLVTQTL